MEESEEELIIDFEWVELIASTKLGYTLNDIRHAYYCEFVDKFRTYKMLFNMEKLNVYQIGKPKVDSLRSL